MTPGLTRGVKKGLRSIVQVVAGGGLTLLVTALTGTLSPNTAMLVMGIWTAFVAFSQNWAEGAGKIKVLLPSPGLIPTSDMVGTVMSPAVGTVEAVADTAGEVTGTVTNILGGVVGSVTGQIDNGKEENPA